MKTKLLSFLMLMVISTGVTLAQEPGRFERGKHHEPEQDFRPRPGERMNELLKLTEKQKEASK